jgi:RHS repeat-associated protein
MTITYNYLNLPKSVVKGTDNLEFIYDATGVKLATKQNGTTQNYYTGAVVYKSDKTPDYILTSSGMIRKDGANYIRQYNITDHLGNVRSVVNQSGTIEQATDYYPYGLSFSNNNLTKNRYLYNGKEIQNQTLSSQFFGMYDYGARYYDPVIGRWMGVDPLTVKMPNWTPYRYAFNNPLRYIDINGLIEWPVKGTSAVNKRDVAGGGYGLINTVVRTSTYLDRDRPPGASNPHVGIDYRAAVGTSFYSLGDGKVVGKGRSKKGGNYITVEYGNGDKVTFRHINSTANGIEIGGTVYEGQILGETGKSGTTNAHLHIDAKNSDGNQIDPEDQNYGTVTNKEFFTTYSGDYQKLRNDKEAKTNKLFNSEQHPTSQDNTKGSSPWSIISSWFQQNPNIILSVR